MRTYYFSVLLTGLLFLISCSESTVVPVPDDLLTQLNGSVTLYSLISNNEIQNRIIYSDRDKQLFDDNFIRANIRISPDRKHFAYVKHSSLHPWFGYYTEGVPTITISDDLSGNETELMSSDLKTVYFIDWISENKIAVASNEDSLNSITVLDLNGNILFRSEVSGLYQLSMLPDNKHLVMYASTQFAVMDIDDYSIKEYPSDKWLTTYSAPFYTDSSFVITASGNFYVEFHLSDNSINNGQFPEPDGQTIYLNADYRVTYNFEEEKQLKLFEGDVLLKAISVNKYACGRGLFLTGENELYILAQAFNIDDEHVMIKVNFNSGKVSRLTNHGEDHFMIDIVFYDY